MLYSDNLHYDRHTYTTHVCVCTCSYIWHICLWPRLMLMALRRPRPRPRPKTQPVLHCSVWGAAYPHAAAACQRHVDARRIKLDFYCHRYYIDWRRRRLALSSSLTPSLSLSLCLRADFLDLGPRLEYARYDEICANLCACVRDAFSPTTALAPASVQGLHMWKHM